MPRADRSLVSRVPEIGMHGLNGGPDLRDCLTAD